MANNNNNRVLGRVGARQLTQNEVEQVTGGRITRASLIVTGSVSAPDENIDS